MQNRTQMIDDQAVLNRSVAKSASFTMTIRDRFVKASPAAAMTITLPNVVEAAGKFFTILGISPSLTNAITITDGGSSRFYGGLGSLSLTAPGDRVTLYSDGETWSVAMANINLLGPKNLDTNFVVEKFEAQPLAMQDDGTAVSGTDTDVNILNFGGANFELINIGTQSIILPVIETDGMDFGRDQTDAEGGELTLGITGRNLCAFKARTDAFYGKLQFSIADVSGTDNCAFGFRKAEAYQAAIEDYNDMAVLNAVSGDIYLWTILANAATTKTDTTEDWDDGETHELEVRVDADGYASYYVDGERVLADNDFRFAEDEILVPFWYFVNDTDEAGKVLLKHFECGPL